MEFKTEDTFNQSTNSIHNADGQTREIKRKVSSRKAQIMKRKLKIFTDGVIINTK